jgi:hypothetical protein
MSEDNVLHFSVPFSLDKDDYFRRTCPNCGRDFKTKADPADMSSIIQPAFRQIEDEVVGISLSTVPGEENPQFLSCPYCNHRAESGDFFTREFHEYLRRYIVREYVLPTIHNALADFSDGLKRSSSPRSGFGIQVKFDSDSTLPPRPITGPESPDMMRIDLLCCGKSIKVRDGYFVVNKCTFCGEDVFLM